MTTTLTTLRPEATGDTWAVKRCESHTATGDAETSCRETSGRGVTRSAGKGTTVILRPRHFTRLNSRNGGWRCVIETRWVGVRRPRSYPLEPGHQSLGLNAMASPRGVCPGKFYLGFYRERRNRSTPSLHRCILGAVSKMFFACSLLYFYLTTTLMTLSDLQLVADNHSLRVYVRGVVLPVLVHSKYCFSLIFHTGYQTEHFSTKCYTYVSRHQAWSEKKLRICSADPWYGSTAQKRTVNRPRLSSSRSFRPIDAENASCCLCVRACGIGAVTE